MRRITLDAARQHRPARRTDERDRRLRIRGRCLVTWRSIYQQEGSSWRALLNGESLGDNPVYLE